MLQFVGDHLKSQKSQKQRLSHYREHQDQLKRKEKKTLMSLSCPQHMMLDLAFFWSPCMFYLVSCAGMVMLMMLKWLPINEQWTIWRTLSMKSAYSLSLESNILLTLYQFTVTTSLRVTELYSHFQIRILKLSDMVTHDQGHIYNTWGRWNLGTCILVSKGCVGCVVSAASLFGDEASRALRNPIGPQGPLGQSLWVRGTPFNEGNWETILLFISR